MKQLINLLTICRKAGRLCLGFDAAKEALATGKAKAVLLSSDASAKTEKEVKFFAAKASVTAAKTALTLDEIYSGIGKKAVVIAICDEGFAKKALQLAAENDNN